MFIEERKKEIERKLKEIEYKKEHFEEIEKEFNAMSDKQLIKERLKLSKILLWETEMILRSIEEEIMLEDIIYDREIVEHGLFHLSEQISMIDDILNQRII